MKIPDKCEEIMENRFTNHPMNLSTTYSRKVYTRPNFEVTPSNRPLTTPLALMYIDAMITTITGKNQVTLPAEIVRALDLTPGTQLEWSIGADRTLIATPQPNRAQRATALYGAGRRYLRPGADPVADLIAERLQDDDASITGL